jgi:hypothetical protein
MIISAKKKAAIETTINTAIVAGIISINNTAIVAIIVPMIPANKQVAFLYKHFLNALEDETAAKNTPETKKINVKTANPKAIQAAIIKFGISPNE